MIFIRACVRNDIMRARANAAICRTNNDAGHKRGGTIQGKLTPRPSGIMGI